MLIKFIFHLIVLKFQRIIIVFALTLPASLLPFAIHSPLLNLPLSLQQFLSP